MRWVGVMRWASGRGGRDALACINPPGYAEDRKKSAGHSAHRGPEGAVDLYGSAPFRRPHTLAVSRVQLLLLLLLLLLVAAGC